MDLAGEERRKYIQKSGAIKARAKISAIEKELERRKKVLAAIELATAEPKAPISQEKVVINPQPVVNPSPQNIPQMQASTPAQPQQNVQTPVNAQTPNSGQSENNKEKNDEDRYMVIEW